MCRPIVWITHLVSAIAAINWGLVKFFQFNIVEYIVTVSQVTYIGELLYAFIMICGIFSLLSLFSLSSCKKQS